MFLVSFVFPVSTKALQGAKSIGSFLYSAVNKAGKTVSEAGAKIKKTVGENVSIMMPLYRFYLCVCIYIPHKIEFLNSTNILVKSK